MVEGIDHRKWKLESGNGNMETEIGNWKWKWKQLEMEMQGNENERKWKQLEEIGNATDQQIFEMNVTT